jgi:hypothetical protein
MITERFRLAQQYLADAQYLLAAERLASAVSRVCYLPGDVGSSGGATRRWRPVAP